MESLYEIEETVERTIANAEFVEVDDRVVKIVARPAQRSFGHGQCLHGRFQRETADIAGMVTIGGEG